MECTGLVGSVWGKSGVYEFSVEWVGLGVECGRKECTVRYTLYYETLCLGMTRYGDFCSLRYGFFVVVLWVCCGL